MFNCLVSKIIDKYRRSTLCRSFIFYLTSLEKLSVQQWNGHYAPSSNMILLSFVFIVSVNDFLNIVLASHHHWDPLVNNLRHNFHNPLLTCGTQTTSLLHDETHGGTLVQQSQLSIRVLGITGVSKDTSVKKSTVHISHHGTNVPRGKGLSTLSSAILPVSNNFLQWFVPHMGISFIETHNTASLRNLDIGIGHNKLPNLLVKYKHMHSFS
mmetsp:Transcript_48563/g.58799  ORF Transcript_48563/g.58799 Transcript_48563/m.58799 type:complete len:211 (+) Transcript_48563:96-728(+)